MAIQVYKYFVELETGTVDNTVSTSDEANQYKSRRKLKRSAIDSPNSSGSMISKSRRDENFPETSQIIEVIDALPNETSTSVQFEVQPSEERSEFEPGTSDIQQSNLSIESGGLLDNLPTANCIDNDFKIEHVGHQNDNDDFHLDNNDLISAVESCNQFLHSLKNRSRSGTNKSVLTPIDRLEIISIWENQTPERPESRASIARRYGVTRECVRQLLKKKDHWKKLAGVDLDKPIPESLFSVDEIKKLQLTLPTKLRPEHKT